MAGLYTFSKTVLSETEIITYNAPIQMEWPKSFLALASAFCLGTEKL